MSFYYPSPLEVAHKSRVSEFNNIYQNNYVRSLDLDNLKEFVSFSAFHDSSAQDPDRRCHPGTREGVLRRMRTWVDVPTEAGHILWLHGPAGVGKSAIAHTVARSLSSGQERVAATFFFSRSDPARNDGNRLFPTIAWQLASSIPEIGHSLEQAVKEDPTLPRKAIEIQFERLIAQPLQELFTQTQETRVIIIDGIDECSDITLQRRLLQIIGVAINSERFPLHFLIVSRSEAHIKDALDPFRHLTLCLDLGVADESTLDIESYLRTEFTRIASEQQLDPSWPGQAVVQDIACKSSGQFAYASTIIRFIGDNFNSASTQLDIVMGLRSSDGRSPFADMDAMYVEVLQRQPGQEFLRNVLSILIARRELPARYNLGQDDSLLLKVDVGGLIRKLRGMHSLLKFEPQTDVHHPSFLEFLRDPKRSGPFHISKQSATRRYLELIMDAVIRHASMAVKQPDYHRAQHFAPEFGKVIRRQRQVLELPKQDWEDVLRPLSAFQSELLERPDFDFDSLKRSYCNECSVFQIIDDLLSQLASLHGNPDGVHSDGRRVDFSLNFGRFSFGLAALIGLGLAWLL